MESEEIATRWSLKDLLPDPIIRAVEENLARMEEDVSNLEAMRECMTSEISGDEFAKALRLLEFNQHYDETFTRLLLSVALGRHSE